MSLTAYKKKRRFASTPEPAGGKATAGELRFVVQKHAASHLHYDFRLEMGGVLKSWAVPKGPSTDPKVKRLAMLVEDHPLDYQAFEGAIPAGNYGAGTVMVWDNGTYVPDDTDDKRSNDKVLRHQFHLGKIKFTLKGKKLKGRFALIKAPGRGENAWLLMKLDDRHASTDDILEKDKSVLSRKTLAQLAKSSGGTAEKKKASKKATERKTTKKKIGSDLKQVMPWIRRGTASPFPEHLSPMLATLVSKPAQGSDWVYEIKWDGYRAIAYLNGADSTLRSRNDKSFDEKFYPITDAVTQWGVHAVVDGEIAVLNKEGLSDFGALQNWRSEADGTLIFYVFDVMWCEGYDLTHLPFIQRRDILSAILPDIPSIRLSETFQASGEDFLETARQMGLEGIIAKKPDSTYQPGARTTDWLKIKASQRQEVVIGGYTKNEDSSKLFSSLLVGVYEDDELVYTGKIGTGFNDKMQREMMAKFKPLVRKTPPFTAVPDINKPSRFRPNPPKATATWLKPTLVCEVSFTEMTSDGVMRHPSFEGMRDDKRAADVVREVPVRIEEIAGAAKLHAQKIIVPAPDRKHRGTFLNPKEETQVREIDGHTIKFTNLSKVYWPDVNVTKRDMLNYYYQVAPYILPYLKNRPQSLNRYPNGIHGKSFYQKDVTGKVPDWISKHKYHSSDEPQDKHFLVPMEEASVLYMASLGSIELNPWSSTVDKPDHPDWCIIDLDPDKNTFNQVIEAAQVIKQLLDGLGVPCYCKTSGSTGLHIYIPLGAKYTYEQSKEFARVVATLAHREMPRFTSIERKVSDRGGKMYIDFLQNRPKATLAAPYSLRPKPGAPVSMPLHWSEVKKGLKITDFNIFNAMERLKETGDLFMPVLGEGIDLEEVVRRF